MEPNVYQFEQIDSTSTHAARLVKEGAPLPFIVCAGEQTAGKGRFGKKWLSPKGNLYLTFAMELVDLHSFALIPIKTAVIISKWIEKIFRFRVTIKWPNDLLFAGKKIAGILCESSTHGAKRNLFIGVGINIYNYPLNIEYETTSLKFIVPISLSIEQLQKSFIHNWNKQWNTLNDEHVIKYYYQFHIGSNQQWVEQNTKKNIFINTAISKEGHLVLQPLGKKHSTKKITSSHHSYRWIYQALKEPQTECSSIIVADIGNSRVKLGFFSDFKKVEPDYVEYINQTSTTEQNMDKIRSFFQVIETSSYTKKKQLVYCASVNEENFLLLKNILSLFDVNLFKIDKRPVFLHTEYKWDDLGIDRIANMEAYLSNLEPKNRTSKHLALIISLGTATVCDTIQNDGKHLGGTILPGIKFSLDNLSNSTNLPKIEINKKRSPENPFGKNTYEALTKGTIQMTECYIKYILNHLSASYPKKSINIIITGGMSFCLNQKVTNKTNPHLTLQGIKTLITGGS